MEEKVELNNKQINAIIATSYMLTNHLGEWFNSPDEPGDELILTTLAVVQNELQALFAACPDKQGQQHSVAEISQIVACALALMNKLAVSFPNVDRIPQFIRHDIKALYWALNDAGLIEAREN